MSKKPPLGSGGRFEAMVQALMAKGHSRESAEAIAASAGRKKFGKKNFASLSHGGTAAGKIVAKKMKKMGMPV